MSQENDCDGSPYTTPLIALKNLPVAADHALICTISDETFEGGLGTHIEGALRGLARYTAANPARAAACPAPVTEHGWTSWSAARPRTK
jgi:hypothetical protein